MDFVPPFSSLADCEALEHPSTFISKRRECWTTIPLRCYSAERKNPTDLDDAYILGIS